MSEPFVSEPFVDPLPAAPPLTMLGLRATGFAPGRFTGGGSASTTVSGRTGFCPGFGASDWRLAAAVSRLIVCSWSIFL